MIFNPKMVKAEMRVIEQSRIELDRGVHFLFCTGFGIKVRGEILATADAYRVDADSEMAIDIAWMRSSAHPKQALLISIIQPVRKSF